MKRPASFHIRRLGLQSIFLTHLLLVATGCALDEMALGSNRHPIDAAGAQQHIIRVDDRIVECWIARSSGAARREPEAFILFFMGYADRADRWATDVANGWGEKPVEAWGMNYPGSGGSEGPPRLARITPAAVATYDALERVAAGRPIFVQAGSLGTMPALSVAARRSVAGVFLQNPLPLRQLILGRYGWWNLWLLAGPLALRVPADLDSVANARRAAAPAVFVLAGADEVIPPRYQRLVLSAYAGPKRIIHAPGTLHHDPLPVEATHELAEALDWLWHATGTHGHPVAPSPQ